jgi:hypothetical protein
MSWSAKTKIIDAATVNATPAYSSKVLLKSDEVGHVQVACAFPAEAIDSLLVYVQTTLDETSEVWDTVSFVPVGDVIIGVYPNATRYGSFNISGCYAFRIMCARDGTTNALTVSAWVRKNGDYKDCTLDV